jgi:flagellar protein FlgJ
MAATPVNASYYADFHGMEALKTTAQQDPSAAIRSAARQFESLFTNMLLKSMREANLGDGLGDSEQTHFYTEMFDQQLAVQMSQGKGLGLAERLVQQLQRTGLAPPGTAPPGTAPSGATPAGAAPLSLPAQPARLPATGSLAPVTRLQREQFVASIEPFAARAAQRLGVATDTIIAHAALETGWGAHLPATTAGPSNNLFGIKASGAWRGAVAEAYTTEYQDGGAASVRAAFRTYPTVAGSLRDYANLLSGSPRFAEALNTGSDVAAFGHGLQRGGYATDPAYVDKLVATAAAVRRLSAQATLKNAPILPTTMGTETA